MMHMLLYLLIEHTGVCVQSQKLSGQAPKTDVERAVSHSFLKYIF